MTTQNPERMSEQTVFKPHVLSVSGNANRVGNIKHNSINTQRNPFSEDMNRPSHALTEDSEFQPMNSEYKSAAHMENMKYLPNVYEPKSESKKKGLKTCVFLILATVFCVGFLYMRQMRLNKQASQSMGSQASQTVGDYATMTKDYGNKMFRAGQQQAAVYEERARAMDKQECLDNVCLAAVLAAVTAFIGLDIWGMVSLCEEPGRCCSDQSYDELSPRQKEIYDENACCWGCNCSLRVLTLCINSFTCCQIICRLHSEIDEQDSGNETYYYAVEEPKAETQPPVEKTCEVKDQQKFLALPAAATTTQQAAPADAASSAAAVTTA